MQLSNSLVSEERLVRIEMLKSLMQGRSLTIQDLTRDVGGRYTYWRDMLSGKKSFGEKIARKIEVGLKLPHGFLDGAMRWDLSEAQEAANDSILPLQDSEPDLIAAFRLLTPEDRHQLLAMAGQMVLSTHGPTLDLMRRLNVETRADDASVDKALSNADAKSPRTRPAPIRERGPVQLRPTAKKTAR